LKALAKFAWLNLVTARNGGDTTRWCKFKNLIFGHRIEKLIGKLATDTITIRRLFEIASNYTYDPKRHCAKHLDWKNRRETALNPMIS